MFTSLFPQHEDLQHGRRTIKPLPNQIVNRVTVPDSMNYPSEQCGCEFHHSCYTQ